MSSLAPRQHERNAATASPEMCTVCVVDPHSVEDDNWKELVPGGRVKLCLVPDAAAALRIARTQQVDLWVVNAELPGLSGLELCSMLRTRSSRTPVFLIANEYSAELEAQAWRSHATLVICKPAHHDAVRQWIDGRATSRPLCQVR